MKSLRKLELDRSLRWSKFYPGNILLFRYWKEKFIPLPDITFIFLISYHDFGTASKKVYGRLECIKWRAYGN